MKIKILETRQFGIATLFHYELDGVLQNPMAIVGSNDDFISWMEYYLRNKDLIGKKVEVTPPL